MHDRKPFRHLLHSNHGYHTFPDPERRESVVGYIFLADLMVVRKRHGRGIADFVKEKYEVTDGDMVENICTRVCCGCGAFCYV